MYGICTQKTQPVFIVHLFHQRRPMYIITKTLINAADFLDVSLFTVQLDHLSIAASCMEVGGS